MKAPWNVRRMRKEAAIEPKIYSDMALKQYTEWTPKELWDHEQLNCSAHFATMFQYLEVHGLAEDDFIGYTGEMVLPSWRRRNGARWFRNQLVT